MQNSDTLAGSLEDVFQRSENRLAAQQKLAELRVAEAIVAGYQLLEHRRDLPDWEWQWLRQTRREQYQELTGIELEEREPLRASLEQITTTGDQTVEKTIYDLRRSLANGLEWTSADVIRSV